ncbi:MAG: type I-C CRISPR-associated protein Cas8c/Csd1 [Oscillospiraceae bacterium]|nr:type I-C CRISPR-associated protein Cas8c/Csd1 [Oscillospiraceae bacterium]
MNKLNSKNQSVAYQTGRLIAEYAAIQTDAFGESDEGMAEKYYLAACETPALEIEKMSAMSQSNLSLLKNEKRESYEIHSKELEDISCMICYGFPEKFTLEQRSEFALGYYFQCSKIRARKRKNSDIV